jgi:hypothetical protein
MELPEERPTMRKDGLAQRLQLPRRRDLALAGRMPRTNGEVGQLGIPVVHMIDEDLDLPRTGFPHMDVRGR